MKQGGVAKRTPPNRETAGYVRYAFPPLIIAHQPFNAAQKDERK